ncbi:quinolinate synthase NadA [Mangrovimonas sp. AS39]|uniref:quinolinate synthase NadA n=1 Tax=Mangrovimonas futianensis TaxID=2895523 RepID=UPI001E2DAE77|nr:quinolinate synthase NadA [Mangrovimonas futianensis]MCF1193075.1 quinolinate synthase NadA [Mangrovimonas futianensis]MCF1196766.1 quinolinate synthase NadA [Mangrovimonas futianensis]
MDVVNDVYKRGYIPLIDSEKKVDLVSEIKRLKKEKNAVILAHYYQEPIIQDLADYVGDSLGLSRKAAETEADIILFAGVHFMAETAKILNPTKKVILPDLNAGCSLADSCNAEDLAKFKERYPNHLVVTYVNTSAEVKAISDICCTSSNAEKIVQSIPLDQPIIFAPDKNLGSYIKNQTGRDIVLWDGACIVHEAFSLEKLIALYQKHPKAQIIAHPESEAHILKVANYIGSTSELIDYVKTNPNSEFIVATEAGVIHEMQKAVPNKILVAAPAKEDNTCACSECAYMKMNTLEKVYSCLKYELPEIHVDQEIQERALIPIQRMLDIS